MTATDPAPTIHPDHVDLVRSVHEAVEGVVAACPRSLYLRRARAREHAPELWDAMVAADLLAIGIPRSSAAPGAASPAAPR